MNADRNNFIDFLKGAAIILVIVGHVIQWISTGGEFYDNPVFKLIYSFHMPLFMGISGYLFFFTERKRTLREIFILKNTQLLVPLFIWTLVVVIFFQFQSRQFSLTGFIRTYLQNIPRFYWYVFALYICTIVHTIVVKYFKKYSLLVTSLLVLSFFLVPDFSAAKYVKFLYPYFVAGYYINRYSENLATKFKTRFVFIIASVLFMVMLLLWSTEHYIYTTGIYAFKNGHFNVHQIGINFYRYSIGLLGCIAIIGFLKVIYGKKGSYISEIGKKSLGIYLVHLLFVNLLHIPSASQFSLWAYYLYMIALCALLLFISLFITGMIEKSHSLRRYLLGGR